uniref:Large ribosomal subunit protein bL32c n=1 Tax=Acleisanthes obtusa TaxID=117583 RepID=A0A411L5T4_9CARY|nr:ribosomal protein L32 [Acleisanthes obtusa]QBE87690.1 ribosomal protein L32 [Acleisanthes obtusa]
MAVPKKRTSVSKKRIRKKNWIKQAKLEATKALSLGKSVDTRKSKFFYSPYMETEILKRSMKNLRQNKMLNLKMN